MQAGVTICGSWILAMMMILPRHGYPNKTVNNPWYEVDFGKEMPFNTVVITETANNIIQYRLEYFKDNRWMPLLSGNDASKIKIHRFNSVWGEKLRILIDKFNQQPGIAELGVYDERR